MAGSYNRIVLVGNLTRDPEIRYVDGGGKAVTKFSLAVNRRTKQGDETMFIDIVAWDRLGEICNQYLKKGMSALVEGRLAIRNYETKEGEKRKAVEVVASDMQMLDSKGGRAPNGEGGSSYGGASRSSSAPASGSGIHEEGELEDEIPF
ncbi:MAG: single-stranded DNA-binding protein [Candidatus Baltobacteraceae bacterium]|jgi:single-strand DNA-binding protein